MLFELLFLSTAHFALLVLTAFVFFAAGLLYLDSWQVNKKMKTPLLRSTGFFLLALVASLSATSLKFPEIIFLTQLLNISGLFIILISLTSEPVLHPPKKENLAVMTTFALPVISQALIPLSGVLMLLIAVTYFRRATEGLDKQLKPAAIAFFFLALSELVRISFFWEDTSVIFWSKLLAPLGIVWNIHDILQFVGIGILGVWVWGYIRFRLQVQLFTSTVALSLVIFLITTFFYTFLLLKNLEDDALIHLKTDVNVLKYSLESLSQQTLAQAQAIAQDSSIKEAFAKNDKDQLYTLTTDYLLAQKTSTLIVASSSGQVVMRSEDRDRVNDSISTNPVVLAALEGKEGATVSYSEGIVVPEITVLAAVPIRDGSRLSGKISGVVLTGFTIDSAFVDGVKAVTGLDTAVFGKDKRAATTFVAADGKSRFTGTIETNKEVLDTVLEEGNVFVGASEVLNQPYYTAYAPLKASDNSVIGMLFVGKLQNTLSDAAKRSIDLTFLGSIVLILISLIPAYFFSRFLQEHLEA